ncbi:protein of unknown function [Blastococcus saxobsidens DD2]|uniref:Uncharacterized protein n=1 Tax=Blastococcus saxobsidens (strain DD2) TaxID=1146883 RepID=H6RJT5_BLASD|nr:protein of unknown function [Blastococcus saxobsidens DD2]
MLHAGPRLSTRDRVELHLWPANSPGVAGTEPHLAGSASFRVAVADVVTLTRSCAPAGWCTRTAAWTTVGGAGLSPPWTPTATRSPSRPERPGPG